MKTDAGFFEYNHTIGFFYLFFLIFFADFMAATVISSTIDLLAAIRSSTAAAKGKRAVMENDMS